MTDPLHPIALPLTWDDLHLILALETGRTLSAAARALGVNQTTVSRRLQAAETRLGSPLFHRFEGEMTPTETGTLLLGYARRIEEEVINAAHALQHGESVVGTVRLTAVESVLSCWVIPALRAFYRRYPGVTLDLLGSHSNANLNRREADIALRLAMPREAGLTVRRVGQITFAVYRPAEPGPDPVAWLGYDESLQDVAEARWLADRLDADGARPILRASSASLLLAAVQAGVGQAVLPCYLADRSAGVVRHGDGVVTRPVWLAVQSDVLRSPRVRVVADWLAEILKPLT